ncbi:hypothetical protein DITRI_Ditri08aG0081900 [Diplodiscus trichospermus]
MVKNFMCLESGRRFGVYLSHRRLDLSFGKLPENVYQLDQISKLKVLTRDTSIDLSKFAMILWCIWRATNDRVWQDISSSAQSVVFTALDYLCHWLEARAKEDNQTPYSVVLEEIHRWRKPPPGFIKCNTDAALIQNNNSTGLGMVLRLPLAKEAEALCLLKAFEWIKSMDMANVIFEMDAKLVVDAINSTKHDISEFGSIISYSRTILQNEDTFKVEFTKRQANKVVHTLAKASYLYASPTSWFQLPCFIESLISDDCTGLV